MIKPILSAAEALADIGDGATVMIGGFGVIQGWPASLIRALRERGSRNLTIICNSPAAGPTSLQILGERHQIRRLICTLRDPAHHPDADRRADPRRRDRARAGAAGHAGRARARRRRRPGRVLHAHRRRHRGRRGQGGARLRRQALHPRARHPRRLRVRCRPTRPTPPATSSTDAARATSTRRSRPRPTPRSPR